MRPRRGDVAEELHTVGKAGHAASGSSHFMEITVDSWVAVVMTPPHFALGHRLRPSPGPSIRREVQAASGNIIMNQGENRPTMRMETNEGGSLRMITFQIVGVTKTVASQGHITAKCVGIVLGDEDACVEHKTTGSSCTGRAT